MKQYLSQDQTAKLIELGFEKPKSVVEGKLYSYTYLAYTIGELIEILHQYIIPIEIHYEKGGFDYFCLSLKVYIDGMWCTMLKKKNVELVDFLFEGIVKLKEERII